jgi:hypothetical protein
MKYPSEHLGKRVVEREGGVTPPAHPHPSLLQASGQIIKDDVRERVFPPSRIFALFLGASFGAKKPLKKFKEEKHGIF